MRVILLASVSLAASSIAFAACGGATVETPQDDSGTTSPTDSSIQSDSTAARDSGPIADAIAPRDAAVDSSTAPPQDGGTSPGTPTPDQISCGATSCNSTMSVCCTDRNQAQTCIAKGTTCAQGIPQSCDDKADCSGGDICCGSYNGAPAIECKPACGSFQGYPLPQFCKTGAECGGGVACVTTACSGRTVQTCGPINPQVKQALCR